MSSASCCLAFGQRKLRCWNVGRIPEGILLQFPGAFFDLERREVATEQDVVPSGCARRQSDLSGRTGRIPEGMICRLVLLSLLCSKTPQDRPFGMRPAPPASSIHLRQPNSRGDDLSDWSVSHCMCASSQLQAIVPSGFGRATPRSFSGQDSSIFRVGLHGFESHTGRFFLFFSLFCCSLFEGRLLFGSVFFERPGSIKA